MISRGTNDNVFCSIKHCKAMMWIDTRVVAVVGQRFADNSALLSSDVIHFAEMTALRVNAGKCFIRNLEVTNVISHC